MHQPYDPGAYSRHPCTTVPTMRVVVVGAGFAGLACADELVRLGHDVVVLEARGRVGGRVWSQELVPGDPSTVIERGAEFVLEGYDALTGYAERFGLDLAGSGMSYYVREPYGASSPITAAEVAAAATRLRPIAEAVEPSATLTDFLDAQEQIAPSAIEVLKARAAISWAADEGDLSAHVLLDSIASVQPKPTARIAGGNQGVALALAAALGDRVRLDAPVMGVRDLGSTVEVQTGSGPLTADATVIAIPLPLLEELPIEPALPTDQRDAMARMVRGHAAKLHVPLGSRPGTSAVLDVSRRYWCWTATDGSHVVQSVLHCFAGSPGALTGLGVEKGPRGWIESVRSMRADLDLVTDRAVMTTWDDDPWATFAYSGLGARSRDGDEQVISRPHGRIHLAGEHCAGGWSGLMEGALRSGLHAARQLHVRS
jgi:monoamine oxidase